MAQDINWGGGSGAADALNEILTQRKLEARQAFLDQITAQNAESERSYRAEQAASLAENRAAQAQLRKAQAADIFRKQFHKGQAVDDATMQQAQQIGAASDFSPAQAAIPAVPPREEGFSGPLEEGQTYEGSPAKAAVPTKYLGSPQEQEIDENAAATDKWLEGPDGAELKKNNPELWDSYKMQVLTQKFGGAIPAGAFKSAAANQTVPFVWVDRNGNASINGKPVDASKLPKGAIIREAPAPTAPSIQVMPNYSQDPNAPPAFVFDRRNPKAGLQGLTAPPVPLKQAPATAPAPVVGGVPVEMSSFNTNEQTQGPSANNKPVLTRPPAPPRVATGNSTINPTLLQAVRTARTIATPKALGAPVDPRAQANLDQAINNLYDGVKDSELKQTVREIVANPKTANLTTSQIVAQIVAANPNFPIDRQAALTDLLSTVRNK